MNRAESIHSRIAISLPLVAGLFAFVQSYRRWLDPVIDSGRDLYIPEQLRHGALLYRDVLYYYPPLTPYLLAGVTAVTGSSIGAYIAIGLVMALLTAAAVWLILEPLAGPYAASAALLIFFSFSMCGVRGWGNNYFFPYAHAATLAMLFFLWAVVSMQRERFAAAGLLLAAASWTKIEYVAFSIVLVAWCVLDERARKRRGLGGALPAYAAAMIVLALIAVGVFGLEDLRANMLPPSLLGGAPARYFYAKVTGMSEWQPNLLLALQGAALVVAFAVLLRAWDRMPRLRVVLAVALALATWMLANDLFFRAWTILQLALLPFALRKPREPLALLLLVSLCASSRIVLRVMPVWYGFVFITPVVMLMVYVLFEWLPARGLYSRKASMAWLAVFVAMSFTGLLAAHRAFGTAFPVESRRGLYYDVSAARALAYTQLIEYLHRAGAKELVAMPEGLAVNYLTDVKTPLRYHTFTPVEIAGDEPAVVAELAAKKPQYVVLQPREMTEFGYRGFGDDYGREIVSWLRANYVLDRQFARIVLLRRATTPPGTRLPDSPSAPAPAPTPK